MPSIYKTHIKVFVIPIVLYVSISVFAETVAVSSDFDKIIPVKIPAWAVPVLTKKRLNIADIEKMPRDKNWVINWGSFHSGSSFYVHDFHWGISAKKNLIIYCGDLPIIPATRNYLLHLEAEMSAKSESESSCITVGIFQHGLIHHGEAVQKELVLKRGENIKYDIPLLFDQGTPPFRVMLKISGDIIFKKMILVERPDDLTASNITIVEGTLKDVSVLPDPKKSDYPDCRFTVLLDDCRMISGAQ